MPIGYVKRQETKSTKIDNRFSNSNACFDLKHLNVFQSFIRTADYSTKLHPEIVFAGDITELLKVEEALAAAIE